MKSRTFFAVASFALALLHQAALGEEEMLRGGNMEGPFAEGIATGWVKNCYGSNEAVFAEETRDVHGGKAAQRVTCTGFVSGGVQFHSRSIAVEKGKPYTLQLWMKGDLRVPVYVVIRRQGAPYTAYLGRRIRVKNEWRRCLIAGEAGDSDPVCGVFVMFAGTGTLLVDDVSLLPGHHEEVAASEMPPQKGNRIFNSGFEAGREGWTPTDGFSIDPTTAHSGRSSARLGTAGSPGIECRPFPVRPGMRYTLSAWMKADRPGTHAIMQFFEWADDGGDQPSQRHQCRAVVTLTTEWARYRLSGVAVPNRWEDYVVRIVPDGCIRLDDVQVEEGEASDYRPAHAVEVGAETATRWCRVGERVEVTAHVAGADGGKDYPLRYTLENLWSRPVQTVSRTARAGTPDRAGFVLDRPGMYRVRVRAGDWPATGEVWFGVFPGRSRLMEPGSAFGTHVTAIADEPTNAMRVSEAMGARWVRLHDFGDFCHWYVVEPRPGRFECRDAEIDDLRSRGFTILANLGHPPLWAGRPHPKEQDGGSWTSAPPRDPREWENYVFRTVEHFRGRIRHWEVWNEPYWQGFFGDTPEEYADVLKAAYHSVKRADPQAVVIGSCYAPHSEPWTERVLSRGSLDFMDALSYHVYWSPPLTEPAAGGGPSGIERDVQYLAGLMRRHGVSKPVYMTEGGIRCPPFASWLPKEGFSRGAPFGSDADEDRPLGGLDAACALVRGMVEMRSAGVTNICYYYTGGGLGASPWFSTMANGYYVLLDYDGRPKPTMMAYSALEQQLGAAAAVGVDRRDGLTVHVFSRAILGEMAVVWSDRERTLSVEGARVFDLMGNVMEKPVLRPGEPVFVIASLLAPGELRARLR